MPPEPFDARLERLKGLADGFYGPRSRAPTAERWRLAESIVESAKAEQPLAALPFVSVGADGSIGLRWSTAGWMLDIELADDGLFYCEHVAGAIVSDGPTNERDMLARLGRLQRS